MSLIPGSRIGPYEVSTRIGVGGMGEVYRATDTSLKRAVAIKVLPASVAGDADRLARFQREAEILASLNHPHIAAIHGLEVANGVTALVMELVEGDDLSQRLARGPIPPDEALPIARQIAEALEAAHEQGIIHRDLKPANIKVRADGTVKVLDFGLAKAMEPAGGPPDLSKSPTVMPAMTQAGTILGTAAYMSPEQTRGKPVDKRADIWAFGCVLYELLTGRVAFRGETMSDLLVAVLSREPDWRELPESTPPPLRALVRRCLEKDPRRRLRDIGDARLELESIGDGPWNPSEPASGNSVQTPTKGMSRRQLLAGGAAFGALGIGVGTGAFLWGRSRSVTMPSYHRLTFRRGMIRTARFAPDFQTILYGALWDGDVCRTYAVRPESPESAALNLSPATPLAVSVNGELALSLGTHDRGIMTYGTLARVSLAGGSPREMLEATKFADWAPDGRDLAVVRRVGDREQLEFPMGTVLAEPSTAGGGFAFPRVSPDGSLVAFFELTAAGGLAGTVAIADRRGEKRVISSPLFNVFGLAWNRGEIWFTAADERPLFRNAIHAVTPDGAARVVARIPGNATLHDAAPNGRLLIARTDDRGGIAVLAPGQTSEQDLSWLDSPIPGDISPDGTTILFSETGVGGGPGSSVYLRPTSGAPAVRLGSGRALALSPDGRWALARQEGPTPDYLDLLPTGPGQPKRFERPGTVYFGGQFTPDGGRVVVRAREQGQPPRIYRLNLADGAFDAITPQGAAVGATWALSPDGAIVAVSSGEGVEFYPVSGGMGRAAPGLTGPQAIVGWIDSGLLISDTLNTNALSQVLQVDPVSGRRALWREFVPRDPAGIMNIYSLVVTPDGRAYSYGWHRAISDLYIVEGLS